jgi:hypothetical protein
MVNIRETMHTSFNEAEHNRAFFERLMRLQSSTGQISVPHAPAAGVRGGGRGGGTTSTTTTNSSTNPSSSKNESISKNHRFPSASHQTIGGVHGGGVMKPHPTRISASSTRRTTTPGQYAASPSSPSASSAATRLVAPGHPPSCTTLNTNNPNDDRNSNMNGTPQQQTTAAAAAVALAAVHQQQHYLHQQQHLLQVRQHEHHQQQYMLAAMRNDTHGRQSSTPSMIYDLSTLRQLQQNAVFASAAAAPHHHAAGASLFFASTMASAAPTTTIAAPGAAGASILLAPGTNAPSMSTTSRILDRNPRAGGAAGKLLCSSSSLAYFSSDLTAAVSSFVPSATLISGQSNTTSMLCNGQHGQQGHIKSVILNTTSSSAANPSSTSTTINSTSNKNDKFLMTTNIGNKHSRDEPIARKKFNKKRAVAGSISFCQNDMIFDTALKQLKSSSNEQDDDGLCAGKYLMSIVQQQSSGGKETSADTPIDGFLGGEFIKGIVENDKSMLDLLLSQNFREKVHNDTEKLILDYLTKNAAEKSTTVNNCDRRNKDQHDKDRSKNESFHLTIEDITNMVMAISKHTEKHMVDTARKGVLLSYVEVKNMTHASVASSSQLRESHSTPQKTNDHLRSRIDTSTSTSSRAGDTNKSSSRSNPNWNNTNQEEKMKAMIIEHDQFVKELVDVHNKRESVLLEENETQRVMHSRMVENCLLASSKALKVVRDKVAEEYC